MTEYRVRKTCELFSYIFFFLLLWNNSLSAAKAHQPQEKHTKDREEKWKKKIKKWEKETEHIHKTFLKYIECIRILYINYSVMWWHLFFIWYIILYTSKMFTHNKKNIRNILYWIRCLVNVSYQMPEFFVLLLLLCGIVDVVTITVSDVILLS